MTCHRWCVLILALLLSCGSREAPKPLSASKESEKKDLPYFADVTEQSGIRFVHDAGVDGSYFMPETLGAGGAFFDYDNDGRLDVYLVNSGSHSGPRNAR